MRQIDYPKLLKALKTVELLAPQIRPDKALENVKNLDIRGYDDLLRQCRDFQEDVERAVEDCQAAVESPIYIGVVGHYSHGKSSLLNALLFPPKSGEILPTGEGVVTSLCTLLQFSNQTEEHEFYEVEQNGTAQYLPSDEYQARVSGRGGSPGSTSHFKIRLEVKSLSGSLFRDFAEKQIELLDTPGLGGPYWRDEQALIDWIKEFGIIVVCIKATEIDETTAGTVNPFLRHTTKPIIPVITFWDMWKGSGAFKGIADELKARDEAKQRLARFFPTLAEYADQTIFASAKNCIEATRVPDGFSRHFTEEWNVDNVRRNLASHVQQRGSVIRTQKSKESRLDNHRRSQVMQLSQKLCSDATRNLHALRKSIQEALPKGAQEDVVLLLKDELQKEMDREIDRMTTQIDRVVDKKIPLIQSAKNWGAETATLRADTETQYLELRRQSAGRISTFVDRFKQTHITPLVNESGLRQQERKKLDQDIKRAIESFETGMGASTTPPQIIKFPPIAAKLGLGFLNALLNGAKELFIANAPLAVVIVIVAPVLMGASWVFSWIPGFDALKVKVIPIVLALWVIILAGVFWRQFQVAMKKALLEAREKSLEMNSSSNIESRVTKDFTSGMESLQDKLVEAIDSRLAPLDEETRVILEDLDQNVERLEESILDVRQLL